MYTIVKPHIRRTLMHINPRTMLYILTIALEQNFSRAAEKLFISQPSLSQHILRAEKELNVSLFRRDVTPLVPTYAGERMIAAAREFFLLEDRLSRKMEDIAGERVGRITVGASVTRGAYIIPGLFSSFKREYPEVELILKEGSNDMLLDLVFSGQADFAFVGSADSNFEQISLRNDELLLAVPKAQPLLQSLPPDTSSVRLELFKNLPFILLHQGQALRNIADQIFKDHGIKPLVAYETHSYDIACQMAASGLGCTFIQVGYGNIWRYENARESRWEI